MRAVGKRGGGGRRKRGAHTNEPLNSKIIKIKSHKEVVEGAPPRVSKTVTRQGQGQRQRQGQGQGQAGSLQSSHSPRSPGLAIANGMAIVAAGAAAEDADAVDAL